MRLLLLFSILGICLNPLSAQDLEQRFPANWEGEWVGDLVISNGGGELQRLPMILRIIPTEDDRHTFTIVYGEDTPENTRPYFLQAVDAAQGHYETDEANGIFLDDFLINGKLYSRFEVMGNLLLTTIEERDGQLIYEIIAGPLEPLRTTGDTIVGEEEIPPVNGYRINVQQRAVLTKKKG
ncbi:MAG: hypothetical protein AAFZ63_21960 [Bacteroidota bacterium]